VYFEGNFGERLIEGRLSAGRLKTVKSRRKLCASFIGMDRSHSGPARMLRRDTAARKGVHAGAAYDTGQRRAP
jgi:hypothetical protein